MWRASASSSLAGHRAPYHRAGCRWFGSRRYAIPPCFQGVLDLKISGQTVTCLMVVVVVVESSKLGGKSKEKGRKSTGDMGRHRTIWSTMVMQILNLIMVVLLGGLSASVNGYYTFFLDI